jgi:hypothetical protein
MHAAAGQRAVALRVSGRCASPSPRRPSRGSAATPRHGRRTSPRPRGTRPLLVPVAQTGAPEIALHVDEHGRRERAVIAAGDGPAWRRWRVGGLRHRDALPARLPFEDLRGEILQVPRLADRAVSARVRPAEPDLGHATSRGPRQAQLDGFDLHANVWVPPTIVPALSSSAATSSAPRSPRTASTAGPMTGATHGAIAAGGRSCRLRPLSHDRVRPALAELRLEGLDERYQASRLDSCLLDDRNVHA